ncbi:MAG: endonuclease domain-containing protein [Bacteroidota bacterium]
MRRIQINNIPRLKERRQQLRSHSTSSEATLWKSLQKSQLAGRKFRRQHSIGPFIVDFYCPAEKLAVELDGAIHFKPENIKYDKKRTEYIEQFGIRVIRIENVNVFTNLTAVLEYIKDHFINQSPL